jgi:sugar-specific transcriptional regulator TrmB
MNDDAVDGLEQLELTTYEEQVFLGLRKLGRGTASDVSDIGR